MNLDTENLESQAKRALRNQLGDRLGPVISDTEQRIKDLEFRVDELEIPKPRFVVKKFDARRFWARNLVYTALAFLPAFLSELGWIDPHDMAVSAWMLATFAWLSIADHDHEKYT